MTRGRRLTALLPCLLILSLRNLLRADGELTPPNTVFFQALSGPLFFDLVNDPNEYSPVNLDTINSDYSDAYSTLLSRAEYWSDIVKTPEEPDATVKKKTWKAAGGIVPWLTDVNYTTTVIEQKYSYTDAPNIIFVLVDDWVSSN